MNSKMVSGALTLCADNTVVRGFRMGDRCSFFHMALIGLIVRNTFLSISPINAMWKNEHLSPIPKPLTTVLSARSVKDKVRKAFLLTLQHGERWDDILFIGGRPFIIWGGGGLHGGLNRKI